MAEFPFDSTRKRMSLVIQTENMNYCLMSKGADSILLPRCNFNTPQEKEIFNKTNNDLYGFAVEGLRTLVMGKKQLTLM